MEKDDLREEFEWWVNFEPGVEKILEDLLKEEVENWGVSICDISLDDDEVERAFDSLRFDILGKSLYISEHGADYWIGRYEGEPVAAGWVDGGGIYFVKGGKVAQKFGARMKKITELHDEKM